MQMEGQLDCRNKVAAGPVLKSVMDQRGSNSC
jgi:hypothetical protein